MDNRFAKTGWIGGRSYLKLLSCAAILVGAASCAKFRNWHPASNYAATKSKPYHHSIERIGETRALVAIFYLEGHTDILDDNGGVIGSGTVLLDLVEVMPAGQDPGLLENNPDLAKDFVKLVCKRVDEGKLDQNTPRTEPGGYYEFQINSC